MVCLYVNIVIQCGKEKSMFCRDESNWNKIKNQERQSNRPLICMQEWYIPPISPHSFARATETLTAKEIHELNSALKLAPRHLFALSSIGIVAWQHKQKMKTTRQSKGEI